MATTARRTTPNIGAVAREAGVSVGTVSNALNNPERLAPDTLGRVREAIVRLGYIRSSAGRTLIRNQSDALGLIVPDLVNELFVEVARGAQLTASENGTRLVLANSGFNAHGLASGIEQHDVQDEFLEHFAEARVGGVMVCSMRAPGAGIERIRNHVRPVVVVNYDVPDADWCTVLMDNEQVGSATVEHIASLGIRRAYFVSTPDIVQPVSERRRGIHRAAAAGGIHVTDVTADGLTASSARRAVHAIMDDVSASVNRGERVAILGITDSTGIGILQVLRENPHLRVPDDVAVVGMDGDHRQGGIDWITMTSILLPGYEMGAEGVRLLEAEADPDHVHERVVLPVRIRPAQSTIG